jgi:hypothetical protein
MMLDAEYLELLVLQAFHTAVVGVSEPDGETFRKAFLVHRETVILTGDKHTTRGFVPDGMIHA